MWGFLFIFRRVLGAFMLDLESSLMVMALKFRILGDSRPYNYRTKNQQASCVFFSSKPLEIFSSKISALQSHLYSGSRRLSFNPAKGHLFRLLAENF